MARRRGCRARRLPACPGAGRARRPRPHPAGPRPGAAGPGPDSCAHACTSAEHPRSDAHDPTPETPPVAEPSGPSPAEIQAQREAEAKARAAERKRRAEALARRRAEERKRKAAEKRQKELSGLTTFSNTLTKASERVGKVKIDVPVVTGTSSRSSAGGVGNTIPLLLVLASLVCAGLGVAAVDGGAPRSAPVELGRPRGGGEPPTRADRGGGVVPFDRPFHSRSELSACR